MHDDEFPRKEFENLAYHVETAGQRAYNGVAILSRSPLRVEHRRLPGNPEDDQARYIEATVELPAKRKRPRQALRVVSLYLPNGNPAGSESFAYKLGWMTRLIRHARQLLKEEEVLVLGGDFNVAPTDADVFDPFLWGNDALCRPETRTKFRKLLGLGLTDAIPARHPQPGNYACWITRTSLGQEPWLAHRSSPALPSGSRQARRLWHRQEAAWHGEAVRSCSGLVRRGNMIRTVSAQRSRSTACNADRKRALSSGREVVTRMKPGPKRPSFKGFSRIPRSLSRSAKAPAE